MAVIELDSKTALLAFCIQNPEYSSNIQNIMDLYENEDYIIAWYIRQYTIQHFKLSEKSLNTALISNAVSWVKDNSLYTRRSASYKVAREYIQSCKPDMQLVTPAEYAQALRVVVITRYKELLTFTSEITKEDIPAIMEGVKKLYNDYITSTIIQEAFKLTTGDKEYVYLGRVKYDKTQSVRYMKDASIHFQSIIDDIGKVETYEDKISRQQEESIKYQKVVFQYRLGNKFLQNPVYGRVTTLNAMPKVGKSKFMYGEVCYPAIANGKNVLLLSGEMSGGEVQQQIIAKHIYCTTGGKKIPQFIIGIVLGIIGARRLGTVTKAQETLLKYFKHETIDAIIIAEYELFHSGEFGKLDTVYQGDIEDPKNKLFYIEDLRDGVIDIQRSEHPYDVVIIDHMGFIKSRTGQTDLYCMRTAYQDTKAIAKNPYYPCHVYDINHSNTAEGKQAQKDGQEGRSQNGNKISGYGSSEEGKIADTSLAMTMSPQQEQDGIVSMLVNYDRWTSHAQTFSTNEFELIAQKDVCDYCLKGSIKEPYYYKNYKKYKEEANADTDVDTEKLATAEPQSTK